MSEVNLRNSQVFSRHKNLSVHFKPRKTQRQNWSTPRTKHKWESEQRGLVRTVRSALICTLIWTTPPEKDGTAQRATKSSQAWGTVDTSLKSNHILGREVHVKRFQLFIIHKCNTVLHTSMITVTVYNDPSATLDVHILDLTYSILEI